MTTRSILSSPTMVPSWVTPSRELAVLRAWLWLAICVDVVSSCLYLFLPAGSPLLSRHGVANRHLLVYNGRHWRLRQRVMVLLRAAR